MILFLSATAELSANDGMCQHLRDGGAFLLLKIDTNEHDLKKKQKVNEKLDRFGKHLTFKSYNTNIFDSSLPKGYILSVFGLSRRKCKMNFVKLTKQYNSYQSRRQYKLSFFLMFGIN